MCNTTYSHMLINELSRYWSANASVDIIPRNIAVRFKFLIISLQVLYNSPAIATVRLRTWASFAHEDDPALASRHLATHHVGKCHAASHHTAWHRVTSHHTTWHRAAHCTARHVTTRHVTSRHATSRDVTRYRKACRLINIHATTDFRNSVSRNHIAPVFCLDFFPISFHIVNIFCISIEVLRIFRITYFTHFTYLTFLVLVREGVRNLRLG